MDIVWIFWLVGILLVWILVRYILVYRAVSNIRCRIPAINGVDTDSVPNDMQMILGFADPELVALGFRFLCFVEIRPAMYQTEDDEPEFSKVFYHAEKASIAIANLNSFWQLNNPVRVVFDTTFGNYHCVQTASLLSKLGPPAADNVDIVDAETHDLAAQWQLHETRIDSYAQASPVAITSMEFYLEVAKKELEKYTEFWLSRGILRRRQNSGTELYLSFRSRLHLTRDMLKAVSKASRHALKLSLMPKDVLAVWDKQIIKRLIIENKTQSSWMGKFLFFCGQHPVVCGCVRCGVFLGLCTDFVGRHIGA